LPKISVNGAAFNYARLGSWTPGCTPLILVHGLAASSAFWMRAAEPLSAWLPVLVYDLRGHGRSAMPPHGYSPANMAEDLVGLMSVLEISAAMLAGHSFGGSVALHATLASPERVRSLVIADSRLKLFQPAMTPASWPKWPQRKEQMQELGIEIADDDPEGGHRLLTEMAKLQLRGKLPTEGLPRWIGELFGHQSRFTAERWVELVERTPALKDFTEEAITAESIRELHCPLLAVYGEHSPALPSAHGLLEFLESSGHARLRTVPQAGHFFPLTKPEAFVEAVTEFIHEHAGLLPAARH
jgi:pimeloyl-ACP methyl ester carboxylesterase